MLYEVITQALKARIQQQLGQLDALLLPTAPRLPTLAQVRADPVVVNSQLGHYCNWVNLADCCALSLPAGFRPDGLPLGVTLVAPAWQEWALARLAKPLAAGFVITSYSIHYTKLYEPGLV